MRGLKFYFLTIVFILSISRANAQNEQELGRLNELVKTFSSSDSLELRVTANYQFIKGFVDLLKQPNSFNFKLDTFKSISTIYSADNSFRICTWAVKQDLGSWRHFGCIQFNQTPLMLVPLMDQSDKLGELTDSTITPKNWFGCVYYGMIEKKYRRKKYYTLVGYDAHEPFSQKKILEVMTIDKKKVIRFGAPIFKDGDKYAHRLFYEYSKTTTMALRWEKAVNMIVVENLIPPKADNEGQRFTYVPDGSLNGFYWKKGKWLYKENIVVGNPKTK